MLMRRKALVLPVCLRAASLEILKVRVLEYMRYSEIIKSNVWLCFVKPYPRQKQTSRESLFECKRDTLFESLLMHVLFRQSFKAKNDSRPLRFRAQSLFCSKPNHSEKDTG